jgi:hypothetical protein
LALVRLDHLCGVVSLGGAEIAGINIGGFDLLRGWVRPFMLEKAPAGKPARLRKGALPRRSNR